MTLTDLIDFLNRVVPPCVAFQGICYHGNGVPNDNSSPFFVFYIDDDANRLYINGLFTPERTLGSWIECASADVLAPIEITT